MHELFSLIKLSFEYLNEPILSDEFFKRTEKDWTPPNSTNNNENDQLEHRIRLIKKNLCAEDLVNHLIVFKLIEVLLECQNQANNIDSYFNVTKTLLSNIIIQKHIYMKDVWHN